MINLQKWSVDVCDLWSAVQEHDDLLYIKDLDHISDHRATVDIMVEFYTLMRKTK